jgi:hypothetical protein
MCFLAYAHRLGYFPLFRLSVAVVCRWVWTGNLLDFDLETVRNCGSYIERRRSATRAEARRIMAEAEPREEEVRLGDLGDTVAGL